MLQSFMLYYDLAAKALDNGEHTWAKIRESTADEWHALTQMVRRASSALRSELTTAVEVQ